jgi:hypothetical protein
LSTETAKLIVITCHVAGQSDRMLRLLFARDVSVCVTRSESGSDFIKLIDDSMMRDTIKKVKNSVVFFHADHQHLSDVASGHYVSVAK